METDISESLLALLSHLPSELYSLSKGRHWMKEKGAEVEKTQISNLFCFILAPENFVCVGTGVSLSAEKDSF